MSGRLVYGPRSRYPHMAGEDKAVWERFIEKFPDRFETVDYDFRVGEGETPPADFPENYARMVTSLSQLRIDAVCWIGEKPTIVEVKPRGLISAVGQLTGYRVLWMKDFKEFGTPDLLLVCGMVNDDALTVFRETRITVQVV